MNRDSDLPRAVSYIIGHYIETSTELHGGSTQVSMEVCRGSMEASMEIRGGLIGLDGGPWRLRGSLHGGH